jgi:hypothetical protein
MLDIAGAAHPAIAVEAGEQHAAPIASCACGRRTTVASVWEVSGRDMRHKTSARLKRCLIEVNKQAKWLR